MGNPNNVRYLTDVPRKPLPEGRVVVHNHVIPAMPLGTNGFRAWTQTLTPQLEVCDCSWAPSLSQHYRVKVETDRPADMERRYAEAYTQGLAETFSGIRAQVALGQRLGVPQALGLSTPEWMACMGLERKLEELD